MKSYSFILIAFVISSCSNKDFDENDSLHANALTTPEGGVHFTPMHNEDSAAVISNPAIEHRYDGNLYTGKIVNYDEKKRKTMEGSLKDGYYDGKFIFYYPSGVVQMEGNYVKGYEDGMWYSYYSKDKPMIVKYYDNGYMLMRKEYYDTGRIKNYQNTAVPQFGNIERRVQFKYNGELEYIDAEREVGKLTPKELNELLVNDGLLQK